MDWSEKPISDALSKLASPEDVKLYSYRTISTLHFCISVDSHHTRCLVEYQQTVLFKYLFSCKRLKAGVRARKILFSSSSLPKMLVTARAGSDWSPQWEPNLVFHVGARDPCPITLCLPGHTTEKNGLEAEGNANLGTLIGDTLVTSWTNFPYHLWIGFFALLEA